MDLINQLIQFSTGAFCSEEEQPMVARFLSFLENNPSGFERAHKGHITSSVWIVNAERTHALLTHHRKLDIWVQLGGHNDGVQDCKAVAALEALEESGILGLQFLHEGIFDVDIHEIAGACAYHYDVRYLLQAPEGSNFIISEESYNLAWLPFDKIADYTQEPSVLRLNDKFRQSIRL